MIKSVMPSSIHRSGANTGYGKRSNPGLVTIGGGNGRQSRGWTQFDSMGTGTGRVKDEQYGITDIEMGPRTTVTASRADTESASSAGGTGSPAGPGGGGIGARDSDEFPIMSISKTTQVQWTVEERPRP